ncbi:uncharacterized protein LOC124159770 [Ischnura elegans]|uniref:uncharacterized protein LOC124159770 n=1 Tax=Ischnura elegans TaxID=197161 RepID=UPI001ED8B506|nr:uncharacterized protein LOC124159770 [Ischnura elegans]
MRVSKTSVIAHNTKAYDSQFILKSILEKTSWKPKLLMNGSKIMSISYSGLRFIDSLNFLPMVLSKLPAALGLPKETAKGYFPHFFNTARNSKYEGELPHIHFCGPDNMSSSERTEFTRWHKTLREDWYKFIMQNELVSYCIQDVNILRLASLKFREMFLSTTSVDPFREALTIASACMAVFRKNFLRSKTISTMPSGGYRWVDQQSFKAILWILFEERKRGISIQHAGNGREVKVLGRRVDGYHKGDRETIFEYHGCFFHGCKTSFIKRDEKISNGRNETVQSRFETTEYKTLLFRKNGYNVVEMWECDFEKEILKNSDVIAELKKNKILDKTPINPREVFYGGRTNAIKLYKKTDDSAEEKIRYYDVCSLYPYVNKYMKYPVGHPKIYVGEECPPINEIEGLKCSILPPTSLYHPVLPVRVSEKLMFPLFMKCATTRAQTDCSHEENERAITGTWVSEEIKMAVNKGYKILEMHEAWHYDTDCYYVSKKQGGLFTEYINCFLKLKQEASGWPSWCTSEAKKCQYIKAFKERENIDLDPQNIRENAGMRSLAKLMLNSFWGKFGQRENLPQCSILKSGDEMYKLLHSPHVEVSYLLEVNEETVYASWCEREESLSAKDSRSIIIVCYTTTHARLELYKYLDMLKERIIYFDTDSIIFSQKPGESCPSVGDNLGDMTDELEKIGSGAYIDEIVSSIYAPVINSFLVYLEKVRHFNMRGVQ